MNSRQVHRFHRRAKFTGAALALAFLLACLPATGAQLYQVVRDSSFTPVGDGPSLPLRGTFRLVPQVSPLDWEQFMVELVRLETTVAGGAAQVWRGSGFYSRGGRAEFTQRLWLDLSNGADAVRFDSGTVPADAGWPDLDLILNAPGGQGSILRLQAVPELARWHYRSVAGTTWLDDCAVCDRPPILVPVAGGFDLVHTGGNPLFERYHVLNLRLSDGFEPPGVEITGEGVVEIGGEVAIQQRWTLHLNARTPAGTRAATLQNPNLAPARLWPMLSAELVEDGGTDFSRFYLALAVAPFRELWFTTTHGLTSGTGGEPFKRVSGSDLLSDAGRVVVAGATLLKGAGLAPELGIDGFDVIPGSGGNVAFSIDRAAVSSSLGEVSGGDLVTSQGQMLWRNHDLLAAFGFMPPVPDLGLDAVSLRPDDEYWFSVREPAFSEKQGRLIGRGDLLSSRGQVVRAHTALLARFKPAEPDRDHGLDAFFVWPSGEVWFSVEEGFPDGALGPITDGDLLSDQGYVVMRNLDLVRAFQPLEDLANFGLEGLLVISDAQPVTGPPKLNQLKRTPAGLELTWQGPGRVFQVEATGRLDDPFAALSPVLPAAGWTVSLEEPVASSGFYRLRAW
jgi:hypothetical protein